MNPTLIGLLSVVIWGFAIPVVRTFQSYIDILAFIGIEYAMVGALGFIFNRYKNIKWDFAVFKNPRFYGRWFFFCVHTVTFFLSVAMVQKQYIPLVILVNYLWPTTVILFSVLLRAVPITRWPFFIIGLMVACSALTLEIAGDVLFSTHIVLIPTDIVALVIVFIGANAWGLYSAISRKHGEATGTSTVLPLFQSSLGLLLPYMLVTNIETFAVSYWLYGAIFLYAVTQFIAYLCWDFGMRKGNVVVLSLCADFIPWLSLLGAHVLLDVEIGLRTVFSAVLLVSGAMCARYGTLPLKAQKAAAVSNLKDHQGEV